VYQRDRSTAWQCRYKVDCQWHRASTNTYDLEEAKATAQTKMIQALLRKEMNLPVVSRKFRDVAKLVVARFNNDMKYLGRGSASFKEYIQIIDKYLIPFFGNYNIENIDYDLLESFDEWRINRMTKVPARSTILNHNATLNHIFNEALKRKYITESHKPRLISKGKRAKRRPAFDMEEARALKAGFETWIEFANTSKSKELRKLLREYVFVLLDTGARPGVELLDMKWKNIRVRADHDGLVEMYVDGKTGGRTIIGRQDTVDALRRILIEQGKVGTLELITERNTEDYVFRLGDGTAPQSFQKLFAKYLTDHHLLLDPKTEQKRVFYSLRHTYATFSLLYDKTPIHTLAEQMGTSVEMIERHYSHLKMEDAVPQLKGEQTRAMLNAEVERNTTYQSKTKEQFDLELKEKLRDAGRKSGAVRRANKQ